jgi:hypothetical protein
LELPALKIEEMEREIENKRIALLDQLVKEINRYIELRKAGNEEELLKCERIIKELSKDLHIDGDGKSS